MHTRDIVVDVVETATVSLVSQWLSGGNLSDPSWQMAALYTMAGFVAYQLTTRQILVHDYTDVKGAIVNDSIKFGTMLAVSRLLGGGSLTEGAWIKSVVGTLVGFAAYNAFVAKHVRGEDVASHPRLIGGVNVALKVGTMLLVSRFLSCEPMTAQWATTSLITVIGFVMYQLVVSQAVDYLLQ